MNSKNMQEYIDQGKHLLGCIIFVDGSFYTITEKSLPKALLNLNKISFFKDENTITTYSNYMLFHYPEYFKE